MRTPAVDFIRARHWPVLSDDETELEGCHCDQRFETWDDFVEHLAYVTERHVRGKVADEIATGLELHPGESATAMLVRAIIRTAAATARDES